MKYIGKSDIGVFFFDCFRAEGLVTDEEEEKREEEEGVSATRLNGGTCMPC